MIQRSLRLILLVNGGLCREVDDLRLAFGDDWVLLVELGGLRGAGDLGSFVVRCLLYLLAEVEDLGLGNAGRRS